MDDPQAALRNFKRTNDFFIGLDSDGCTFDTMEVKHKECFIPNIIRFLRLSAVSKYAREVAEFINLYSHWRGVNRFPGLALTLKMLNQRVEVRKRRFVVPQLVGLERWIESETKLANPVLRKAVELSNDPDLALAYEWSEAVNRAIAEVVREVPPFPYVEESLGLTAGKADVMVVSATPAEALDREWTEHGLKPYVGLIAGQEMGTKKEHIALAAKGKYDGNKILMVGDALGDLGAAQANGALFYPIDPGHEDESWERFAREALPRFFAGTYAGDYMAERIARFRALLPETPPWTLI